MALASRLNRMLGESGSTWFATQNIQIGFEMGQQFGLLPLVELITDLGVSVLSFALPTTQGLFVVLIGVAFIHPHAQLCRGVPFWKYVHVKHPFLFVFVEYDHLVRHWGKLSFHWVRFVPLRQQLTGGCRQ